MDRCVLRPTHMGSGVSVMHLNATLICSAHRRWETKEDVVPWEPATLKPTEAVVRRDHWSALKPRRGISRPRGLDTWLPRSYLPGGKWSAAVSTFAGRLISSVMKFGAKPSNKIKAHLNPRETWKESGLAEWIFFSLSFFFLCVINSQCDCGRPCDCIRSSLVNLCRPPIFHVTCGQTNHWIANVSLLLWT